MSDPRHCPACRTPARAEARFCARCGLWLAPHCPRCDAELPALAIYCDRCGTQVSALPGGAAPAGWPLPTALAAGRAEAPAAPPSDQPVRPDTAAPAGIPRELAAKLEAARASGEMVGERRIVTMLFCDMKGSTEAAESLDPEDWTEIMNGAFEHMIRPVYTYEGTLARLMGDALLAFFGAPIAHEDDPQRAVLAALDILRDMAPYREAVRARWGLEINVRVGINTGLVVVGAVGSDLRVEYSALGDAINLAARMEQTAAPGTVQIAHDTYRHVRTQFEIEPLGGIEIKGKREPVRAYRVLGRQAAAGRARGIEGLHAAMVGRQDELNTLRGVLDNLRQGVGGIVCVMGEAGLGKSRLVAEARQAFARPEDLDAEWHETGSLSYESSQPYGLYQRLMRRVLKLDYNTPTARVREVLAAVTATLPEARQAGALLAFETLFGLEHEHGQAALVGEAFRRELQEALRAWWQARWARQPAVLVFDDMHWSDTASVELLRQMLPLVEQMPLVVLCVLRSERQSPAWHLKTTAAEELHHRYTELVLRPLSPAESSELVDRLLAIAELPDALRATILEKTGGNPFFVEEVVRTLIDSGAVVAEDRGANGQRRRYWRAANAGAAVDIPDNLQALMAARMDRLEDETRSTLQLASVIGRSFYYRVLARLSAVGPEAAATLDRHLGALVRSEMIQEAARVPEVEYKFRNPLMQEATYRTILLKRRREFHQRVGEAMEALFPERLAELAPRLAHHFDEGGQTDRARHYFTLAGDRAARLYANQEAVGHYNRALEMAIATGAGAPDLIHLFTSQGRALELDSQHKAALAAYERMETLAKERGDQQLELAAVMALGTLYSTATPLYDTQHAQALTQRGLALAEALGEGAAEARLLWNLMNSFRFNDKNEDAIAAGERSLALARALDLREQMAYTLNDLFYVYQSEGRLADGMAVNQEARALWRELGNRAMLADNLSGSVIFLVFSGRLDEALANSGEALAISRAINNIWGMSFSQMGVAIVHWLRGDFDRALDAMRATIEYGERAGFVVGPLWSRAQMGMVYCRLGQVERGLALIEETRARVPAMATSTPAMAILFGYVTQGYVAAGALERAEAFLEVVPRAKMESVLEQLVEWGRLALRAAQGRHQEVLARAEKLAHSMEADNTQLLLGEVWLAMGQAHAALGQLGAARERLTQALATAEPLGLRWTLWQTLASLAEVEAADGRPDEAAARWAEAGAHVDYISRHLGEPGLRESFEALEAVQTIRRRAGPAVEHETGRGAAV